MRKTHHRLLLAAFPLALAVSACSNEAEKSADEPGSTEMVDEKLDDLIDGRDGLGIFAGIIDNAGLDEVFEGPAPYTLLAPTDEGFADVPEDELASLKEKEMGAKAATLVLAHVLPGFVSMEDLRDSLSKANDDGVTMRTMSGDLVSFRKGEGDAVTVSRNDGPVATLIEGMGGENGGILVVDKPLIQVGTGVAEQASAETEDGNQ